MRLLELQFTASVPFDWVKQASDHHRAVFESREATYFVDFYVGNWDGLKLWMFQFGMHQTDKNASTMAMTNRNDAYNVLSTVKAVFDDFYQQVHPKALGFYDGDRKPSRMKMYDKFAHYIADRYGYVFDQARMAKSQRTIGGSGTSIWLLTRE